MRKPAVKSFAGWRSITACTNTSPRRQRSADGSSRANPFPPKRSGARSGNCAATGLCSCGLSLRTYTRSMWKVMSICSGRGTESFFNNLPPAPQRAGGVISISWHTNHPFLSRISGISARPRSTASLLFSLCVASIPKPSRRFSFVRGHGRSGQRFPVARSAGFGKLHRNVRLPAAPAPGRTGVR